MAVCLLFVAVGCGPPTVGDDGVSSGPDLPSSECEGYVVSGVCYELVPLVEGGRGAATILQLDATPELEIVGHTTWDLWVARRSGMEVSVETYPTLGFDSGTPTSLSVGDFVGDGVTRIVLNSSYGDSIYPVIDGTPGEPITFEYDSLELKVTPAAALDLADGSSLLVGRAAGFGLMGAYRLSSEGWELVGATFPGAPEFSQSGARSFDANGDGLRDVLTWGGYAEGEELDIFVSDGAGFSHQVIPQACGGNPTEHAWFVGDFTADGAIDLACTNDGTLWVVAGSGDGSFAAPVTSAAPESHPRLRGLVDLGGDGPQILYIGPEKSFLLVPVDPAREASTIPLWLWEVRDAADWNGDGIGDLVLRGEEGGGTYALVSQPL